MKPLGIISGTVFLQGKGIFADLREETVETAIRPGARLPLRRDRLHPPSREGPPPPHPAAPHQPPGQPAGHEGTGGAGDPRHPFDRLPETAAETRDARRSRRLPHADAGTHRRPGEARAYRAGSERGGAAKVAGGGAGMRRRGDRRRDLLADRRPPSRNTGGDRDDVPVRRPRGDDHGERGDHRPGAGDSPTPRSARWTTSPTASRRRS